MTFINLVPPIYYNVKQYGASPSNTAAQNDAAFAAAVSAAAAAAGGGTVFIPEGVYATTGLVLTSLTDVSIKGTGTGAVLAPSAGTTGMMISACTRCHLSDFRIDGGIYGAAIGLSFASDYDAKFNNIHIMHCTSDAILNNGDDPVGMEMHFSNITCRANGGWAYHHTRTTTADHGGCYFTNCLFIYDTQGIGGVKIESSATSTGVFHFFVNCIIDNYVGGPAVWIHNVHHVRLTQLWAAGTFSGNAAVLIDGDGWMNDITQAYILNLATTAGSYNIAVNDTQNSNMFLNIDFDGLPGTAPIAQIHIGSSGANNFLGQYQIFGGQPLTDTPTALWLRAAFNVQTGPITYLTAGNAGAACLAIDDPAHIGTQKWIRNANGSFQMLNTAFTQTIFRVDDGGYMLNYGGLGLCTALGGGSLWAGTGAPGTGLGSVGDYYFRQDTPGTALQRLYVKTASAVWTELLAPTVSATAVAIAASGTIATAGIDVSRVAPTGNVASIVLASGTVTGQTCQVVNESAFTVTFAASGTSHVADGVSAIIAANRKMDFTWDGGTSLWYHS